MRPLRFLLLLLLVVFAASLFTASALADDDDDDDDDGGSPTLIDFTTGTGTATFGIGSVATFDFDVRSGPTGVTGSGSFTSTSGETFSGLATCLQVQGNLAVFEIDNTNPANASRDLVVFVGDFGAAGLGDQINFHITTADAMCPSPAQTDQPTIVGDIVVGDDVPSRRGEDDDEDEDEDED